MRERYSLVETCRKSKTLNTLAQYLYLAIRPLLDSPPAYCRAAEFSSAESAEKKVKVAFICDEMTWQDFRFTCNAIFLHPRTWRKQLSTFKPELLFCEAAWSGPDCCRNSWRGRVYKDHRVPFENRKTLLHVLDYCRQAGIGTAFWGKEDPTFFQHPIYDFTSTALLFDTVFTTAAECIPRYRALGCKQVFLLPFGVNTALFSSTGITPRKNTAVFAGSWFGDQRQRCKAMARLFDYVLSKGWSLDIYDRNSGSPQSRFRFPERYQAYIHPAVALEKIAGIMEQYEYAINVNTVTKSETMLSRRLLQLSCLGMKIISNDSLAMTHMAGLHVTAVPGASNIVCVDCDPQRIQAEFSTDRLFQQVLEQCGLSKEELLSVTP